METDYLWAVHDESVHFAASLHNKAVGATVLYGAGGIGIDGLFLGAEVLSSLDPAGRSR